MNHQAAYKDFTARFKLLISKNPHLMATALNNFFGRRLIGNKNHGDLAGTAIAEFINRWMYDFKAERTDEDQDWKITNEITHEFFLLKSESRTKSCREIDAGGLLEIPNCG